MFDAIAHRYDFLNHFLSGGLDILWRRRAVAALELTGSECVLDLCAGTGDLAMTALTASPPARRSVCVDFAAAMLAVARRKISDRGLAGRSLVIRGDATRIPLADRSVDAVTIGFGIRNVENPAAAFAEMHRVLKPGGRVAILEFAVPDTLIFGAVYRWYVVRVLPRIGRAVSNHDAAYEYLPASIDAFATPGQLVKLLLQSGFESARGDRLALGSVILYTARTLTTP